MSNHLNFLKEYKIIFSIVIISKIIVFLVFPLIFTILHLSRADTFNPFTLWNVWDAPHYIDIASKGYQLTGDTGNFISFFPLLPLLIRLTSFITAQPFLISGYIISTISCFVIAYYFFKLVLLDYPKKIATRSVLLLFIFPTSIFLHAVYTESLFLALTISAFYYLRCKKYLISFVLIAIAGFTRNMTFALLPALLVEIWIQDRKIFTEKITSVVFFIFIGTSGFFAYLLLNFFLFGNFLHFVDVEKLHWHTNFTPFGQGLVYTYNSIFWRTGLEKYTLGIGQIIFFLIGLISSFFVLMRIRISYGIYMMLSLFLFYSMSFWLSMPRYILSLFPIFIFFSLLLKQKLIRYAFFSISFLLMVAFSLIFSSYGPVY